MKPGSRVPPSSVHRHSALATIGSLLALLAGLALGILVLRTGEPHLKSLVSLLQVVGTLWLHALQLIVLPLIVSQLLVAIASKEDSNNAGRMGGLTLFCFVALLSLGALFALAVAPPLVQRSPISRDTLAALNAKLTDAERLKAASVVPMRDWIVNLVPPNPFKAVAEGDILPLIIATALFAIALRNIRTASRQVLLRFFAAVAETCTVFAGYLLRALPLAVFALMAVESSRTGPGLASGIGYFVVVLSGLLLAFTLAQYLIAYVVGGVSIRRFAWGVLPAQATAVATRSSLASLPMLMDGARDRIGLSPSVTKFVLPLSVSLFKVNRTISGPLNYIFLAYLYGVPVQPMSVVIFVACTMLLSFGTPGIPSGGTLAALPLYLAAGIPVEGVVLLKAVDAIPDLFKTLVNVTADMSVATIVARWVGAETRAESVNVDYGVSLVGNAEE